MRKRRPAASAAKGAAIGTAIGGVVGIIGAWALQIASPLLIGASIAIAANILLIGGMTGAIIAYSLATRLPPMLGHYRTQHIKLRETAKRLRFALKGMDWAHSRLEQLDDVVEADAALRHQASALTNVICGIAQVGVKDMLLTGKDMVVDYFRSARNKRMTGTDLIVNAYRDRLEREVEELATEHLGATGANRRSTADAAYRAKVEELSNLVRAQEMIQRIETELNRIRVSLESALLQTAGYTTAAGTSRAVFGITDEFLVSLKTELDSFDAALAEMLSSHGADRTWERLAEAAPREEAERAPQPLDHS